MFSNKKKFFGFLFALYSSVIFSQFVTTWETTTASESISIPMTGSSYNVDWGDLSSTTESGTATHVYTSAGTYIVTITGPYTRINFNNSGDKDKIMSIDSWGTNAWTNLSNAFYGCSNLVNKASDTPNLTSATRLTSMFRNATSIGNSDTLIDSGNWNWVTTGIERMNNMFRGASAFNKDISNWDTSSVDRMNNMFRDAIVFNQDISDWVVEDVTNMNNMFYGASNFNIDISGWTTTSLASMTGTFRNAISFDQDIGGWDISNVTVMSSTFNNVTLSANNYNALLIGWEPQIPALLTGVVINLGSSRYCSPDAITAKADIIANRSWTFNDGGVLTLFTWTGDTDTDWENFTNWQDGYDSDCNIDVTIPSVTNHPIIDSGTDITVNNLTIDSGATLTLNGSLTVEGNLATNDGLTLNSASSIIVDGASTGDFSYKRSLANAQKWYYVSPPVENETIENYISNNSLQEGNSNTGLFYYDNDTALGYLGTGYVFYTPTSTGSFTSGKGYGTQVSSASDVIFTGTMPIGDKSISVTTGGSIDDSNLIGNPYPSYVPVSDLLTTNTSFLSEQTIWLWDNTANDYETYNQMSGHFIPPGQGFFVDVSTGGTFNFLESWQEHQTSDVFYKNSNPIFSIELIINNSINEQKSTRIFYFDDKTIDFDNGYDSSSFSDESENFLLSTRLVGNHDSQNLAIQTLPTENIQNYVIPLFVKGSGELNLSIDFSNKPKDISIYLEDKEHNTFTLLQSDKSHQINSSGNTNGIGRYYIHAQNKSLKLEKKLFSTISIYITENKTLNISGLPFEKTKVTLYNILGKQLKKENFIVSNTTKKISLQGFKKGVYILNLETKEGVISKKIIIK